MKLKKLHIKNIQSIKNITMEFGESGVYHLVGANNIGKSVVIKAIRALFMNVSDNQYKEYLRDDCTTFVVEGEMWDGNRVKLSRGATDYYEWEIDGKQGKLDKTRGKVPLQVERYVKMYVDKEKTKECLNIRMPRSVLTFVDMTAGDNFYLIQKALGTDEYFAATKLADKRRRETAKELKVVGDYRVREEEKLNTLEGIVSAEKGKVERVAGFEETLRKEYGIYQKIEEVVHSAKKLQTATDELKRAKEKVMNVDMTEVRQEMEDVRKIESFIATRNRTKKLGDEVKEAKEKVDGIDTTELKRELKELRLVTEALEEARKLSRLKKEKEQAKLNYEEADKHLTDFMRENKFCPIVAKTLNKKCPFTEVQEVLA